MTLSYKQLFIPLILLYALLSPSIQGDQVFLSAGGKITGEALGFHQGIMSFSHTSSENPLKIRAEQISAAFLSQKNNTTAHTDQIRLIHGDIIPCSLISLDKTSLTITAFDEKKLHIPLEAISHILLDTQTKTTLFSGTQILNKKIASNYPKPPTFSLIIPSSPSSSESIPGTISSTDESSWTGNGINRWRWIEKNGESRLEIPAGSNMIARTLDKTDNLLFSGEYSGPSATYRQKRLNKQNSSQEKGIFIALSSINPEELALLSENETTHDYYTLSLFPDKAFLTRHNASPLEPSAIIVECCLPNKAPSPNTNTPRAHLLSNSTQYQFQLSKQGNEFKLNITPSTPKHTVNTPPALDKQKTISSHGLDIHSTPIHITSIGIFNTEYLPVILKDLQFSQLDSEQGSIIPLSLRTNIAPHSLLTTQGDRYDGTLIQIEPNNIRWLSLNTQSPIHLPRSLIKGIFLSVNAHTSSPITTKIYLHGEGLLLGELTSISTDTLSLKHPILGDFTFPKNATQRLEFSFLTPINIPQTEPSSPSKNNKQESPQKHQPEEGAHA